MNSKTCEKLKEMLEKKSPKYTVSFDGNIIAMSEDFITGMKQKRSVLKDSMHLKISMLW